MLRPLEASNMLGKHLRRTPNLDSGVEVVKEVLLE